MDSMKGLGAALPNKKGGKGKAAAEEDSDEEFDPASLSAAERAQLQQLVKGGLTGNPELIKALQGRLNGLVGRNSGYIDSLPTKARRLRTRVKPFGGNAATTRCVALAASAAAQRVAVRTLGALAALLRRCAALERAGSRVRGGGLKP
jgi:hypothetical protein